MDTALIYNTNKDYKMVIVTSIKKTLLLGYIPQTVKARHGSSATAVHFYRAYLDSTHHKCNY